MEHYISVYLKHFDFVSQHEVCCEKCNAPATDIHHINGRGKDKDVIENLIALCRDCHSHAHSSKEYISKQEFQEIHNSFLKRHG